MNHDLQSPWLSRRSLLKLVGISSGWWFLGSGCGDDGLEESNDLLLSSETSPLARELMQHFSYLSIEPSVTESFASDFERHGGRWAPDSQPAPYSRFLASTDFFQNGGDEAKPVHYVTYYDPYISPCYNPFAS